MKQLRVLLCLAIAILLLVSAASAAPAGQAKIKVLLLVGGGSHDFKNLPPVIASVLEKTGEFAVTITEDRNELTAPKIGKYDEVLIYAQGGELTPDQEKGLTEFVAGGKGLAGIHCASDSFKNSDAYWNMLGGRFTGHGFGNWPIHITAKRNPIVRGISNFEIKDEDYDNKIHPDAKVMVLARWGNDGQPAIWTRDYGKGRVFYTGMGHGKEAFENPSFQEVVVRGMRWAAGRDLQPVQPAR